MTEPPVAAAAVEERELFIRQEVQIWRGTKPKNQPPPQLQNPRKTKNQNTSLHQKLNMFKQQMHGKIHVICRLRNKSPIVFSKPELKLNLM